MYKKTEIEKQHFRKNICRLHEREICCSVLPHFTPHSMIRTDQTKWTVVF